MKVKQAFINIRKIVCWKTIYKLRGRSPWHDLPIHDVIRRREGRGVNLRVHRGNLNKRYAQSAL